MGRAAAATMPPNSRARAGSNRRAVQSMRSAIQVSASGARNGTGPTEPSPTPGQHNQEIYGGWLGIPLTEIESLRAEGAI